jgi:hypothetical protein
MPAKPKAKPRSAKVYDNKLYKEFERGDWIDDPDASFAREYYFRRRHLAWGRADTGHRRLKYEIESEWLVDDMDGTLALIKARDGKEVLEEVWPLLLRELLTSIEFYRGGLRPSLRSVVKALLAEQRAADAKIDAQLKPRAIAA